MESARTSALARGGEIRPLRQDDLPALTEFLKSRFESPGAQFATEAMLSWKYLELQSILEEPLSWVMVAKDRIVAHAGMIRTRVRSVSGAMLRLGTVIDWAADADWPGAGIALYRHALERSDASFLLGGTRTTQAVAAKLGFRTLFSARVYTRWVRPVREFLRRPKTVNSVMRLLHGVVHSPLAPLARHRDWSVEKVTHFDHTVGAALSAAAPHAVAARSMETLNHRLKCPTRSMRAYVLRWRGGLAGCAVGSIGAWEARILDVRLARSHADAWAAAYAVVAEALGAERRVCRVSVLTSAPVIQRALETNRFWFRGSDSVSFYDPDARARTFLPIDLGFFDSDIDFYSV